MPLRMTSRERMLAALDHKERDHVPCAFMTFRAMRGRCQDPYEVCERELEMGLDSWLFIPATWRNLRPNRSDLRGLPVRLPSFVRTSLWLESLPEEESPVFHKEYRTPAGTLTTLVRETVDWPHGNFVPFLDDCQIPRAVKPLVTERSDLDALRSMLCRDPERKISQLFVLRLKGPEPSVSNTASCWLEGGVSAATWQAGSAAWRIW